MRAIIVAGLGFGDEGKGRMVDALTRMHRSLLTVRFNGGPQAAHRVVTDDGRDHVFSQFGSGTLAGAQTYLSHYVTVDLPALDREAQHLRELGVEHPYRRLYVSPECPVLTPLHRAMNQLRELSRGEARHGSCGRGVGEVQALQAAGERVLRVRDLGHPSALSYLVELRERYVAEVDALFAHRPIPPVGDHAWTLLREMSCNAWWTRMQGFLSRLQLGRPDLPETTIFEGAQGVLLDEWCGFHPHTTWSTTTFAQAQTLCDEWGLRDHERVGVLRAYHTRHGDGPFPSELLRVGMALRPEWLTHEHNLTGEWQGAFRVGLLDLPMVRYACRAAEPDVIALTHMDVVGDAYPVATAYDIGDIPAGLGHDLERQELIGRLLQHVMVHRELVRGPAALTNLVELWAETLVGYHGYGPTASATQYVDGAGRWAGVALAVERLA